MFPQEQVHHHRDFEGLHACHQTWLEVSLLVMFDSCNWLEPFGNFGHAIESNTGL